MEKNKETVKINPILTHIKEVRNASLEEVQDLFNDGWIAFMYDGKNFLMGRSDRL